MKSGSLVFFACVWTAIVLLIDGLVGYGLWRQFETRDFQTTTGQVLHSEVIVHRGSKGGKSYGVDIRYQYQVDGQPFYGATYHHTFWSSSGSSWAYSVVASHPVGVQTQVFYDPKNPQDAVLRRGVEGRDLIGGLFITPFNLVIIGLWTWVAGWLRERIFKPVAGGVMIITDGLRTNVRLPQYGALLAGMATMGGLSLASIFVTLFAFGDHPAISTVSWIFVVVVAGGVGVYLWQWRKIHSGDDDLVLDEGARTLQLPETFGRKERIMVGFAEVEAATVEIVEHRNRKGGVSYTYAPTLRLRAGNGDDQKLADWYDPMKADAFTDWLCRRLGKKPAASPDPTIQRI